MVVQQFFKLLMKVIMAFQIVLVLFYFLAFGWEMCFLAIGLLLVELLLYKKELYNNIELSYMVFNAFTLFDMFLSGFLFGGGLGFEYYSWILFCGALFVPFTKNWKIRGSIALMSVGLWEIMVFFGTEPLIFLEEQWEQLFLLLYNDIYLFTVLFSFAYVNERYLRKSENKLKKSQSIANYDPLTSLLNRRGLEEAIEKKEGRGAVVALCDIDDFKKVNDCYGHNAGDIVLQETAKAFLRFSGKDRIVRWGGEEILVYMEETSLSKAEKKLEQMLCYLREKEILEEVPELRITFTAGIAEIRDWGELEEGVKRADELLYEGKKNGKNQIVVEKKL